MSISPAVCYSFRFLSPYSLFLLEKLPVSQLAKKFRAFYEILIFRHFSLSLPNDWSSQFNLLPIKPLIRTNQSVWAIRVFRTTSALAIELNVRFPSHVTHLAMEDKSEHPL